MHQRIRVRLAAPLLAAIVAACDRPVPTAVPDEQPPAANAGDTSTGRGAGGAEASAAADGPATRARLERLTRRFARAMAEPEFRKLVKAELEASPVAEQKLHVGRFLRGDNRRALRELARLNGEPEAGVSADADGPIALEMYLPVPSHRASWRGGDELLVASALTDRDAPIAYDLRGRRHVLSPDAPPTAPVLAIVPAETDFDRTAPSSEVACGQMMVSAACGSTTTSPTSTLTPGLYMSKVHLREEFESWLKGAPEIEILVLGQKGSTDSLTKYQCIGQRAAGSYYFDQNSTNWSGNVLLFSQTQLNNYKAQHPGQALRIFFMEDDDTACELRNNNASVQTLLGTVDGITRGLSGGRDSTTSFLQRIYKYAVAAQKIYAVVASFINTNDDMIGNAAESVTIGEYYTGYNWVLKGDGGRTNGYINLLMR
jgi:hypothetical protein